MYELILTSYYGRSSSLYSRVPGCEGFATIKHYQHGFTLEEVSDAVKKAGLKIRNVYDAFSHNAPDDNSERLYYIIEK